MSIRTRTYLGPRPCKRQGFTLIEVMIAVAVVSILVALAIPSYQRYVIRGKRAAAQSQMLDIANREQQFLLANRVYVDKTALEASGFALPADISNVYTYTVTVGAGTVPSYTITFTPIGAQASDGNLTLDSEGVKSPASKW